MNGPRWSWVTVACLIGRACGCLFMGYSVELVTEGTEMFLGVGITNPVCGKGMASMATAHIRNMPSN